MSDANPFPEQMPTVVAPASRFLAVTDLAQSLAFYRTILGFEVRSVREKNGAPAAAEVACGPAAIQLAASKQAYDSTGEPRPCGSAIVFLQTDDVAAMRDALIARGGKPTELERVNWIKMRMFEIRDPDGHSLLFGQSFQEPSSVPDPERQLRKGLPELPLDDVPAGVAYYRDVLGFQINYAQDDIGVMDRDDVTVLLIKRTEQRTGIGSFYAYVRDADALHAELVGRGARVQGKPVSHPWGLRDFQVLDLAGNRITFGQPFE
jgi:uncharacterized glyoxalase superfamily protein PhnB